MPEPLTNFTISPFGFLTQNLPINGLVIGIICFEKVPPESLSMKMNKYNSFETTLKAPFNNRKPMKGFQIVGH